MAEIDVRVESLVINGMESFNRERFHAALSGELAQLVSGGLVSGSVQVNTVRVDVSGSLDSYSAGIQVAQAIHAQIYSGAP